MKELILDFFLVHLHQGCIKSCPKEISALLTSHSFDWEKTHRSTSWWKFPVGWGLCEVWGLLSGVTSCRNVSKQTKKGSKNPLMLISWVATIYFTVLILDLRMRASGSCSSGTLWFDASMFVKTQQRQFYQFYFYLKHGAHPTPGCEKMFYSETLQDASMCAEHGNTGQRQHSAFLKRILNARFSLTSYCIIQVLKSNKTDTCCA